MWEHHTNGGNKKVSTAFFAAVDMATCHHDERSPRSGLLLPGILENIGNTHTRFKERVTTLGVVLVGVNTRSGRKKWSIDYSLSYEVTYGIAGSISQALHDTAVPTNSSCATAVVIDSLGYQQEQRSKTCGIKINST